MRLRVRPIERTRLSMVKPVPRPESLLTALPAELSQSLFAKARPVSVAASETLFVAGEEGDGCYRVDEGLLKASVAAATGGERISQSDLAAMAGIARENVSRVLHDWAQRSLVSRLAGYYCLEKKAALEREAEG